MKNSQETSQWKWWQWPLWPFAFVVVILRESYKALSKKAYEGFSGVVSAIIGAFAGMFTAYSLAEYLGWQLNFGFASWIPLSLFGGWCVFAYVWPIAHIFVFRPFRQLVELLDEGLRILLRDFLAPVFAQAVALLRYLPGADRLWSRLNQHSWFIDTLDAGLYVASLAICAHLAWQVFDLVPAHLHLALLPAWSLPYLAFALAGMVFMASVSVSWRTLSEIKFEGRTIVLPLIIGAALFDIFGAQLFAIGLSKLELIAGTIAVLVVYVAYIFPVVCIILSSGFFKRLLKRIEKLVSEIYGDDESDFARFSSHIFHVGLALFVGYFFGKAYVLLGMNKVLVGVLTYYFLILPLYNLSQRTLKSWTGLWAGVVFSLVVGYWSGQYYALSGLPYPDTASIFVGFFAIVASFFLIFPPVAKVLKIVLTTLKVVELRFVFDKFYNWQKPRYEKFVEYIRFILKNAYVEKSAYRDWVVQVSNLGVSVLAFYALTGPFFGITSAIAAAVAMILYAVLGRHLMRSSSAIDEISATFAVTVAIIMCAHAYFTLPDQLWVMGCVFVSTIAMGYLVAFPVVYNEFRTVAELLLVGWSTPILVGAHNIAWSVFEVVWKPFKAILRTVKRMLGPVWKMIVAMYDAIATVYQKILDALRRA